MLWMTIPYNVSMVSKRLSVIKLILRWEQDGGRWRVTEDEDDKLRILGDGENIVGPSGYAA